MISSPCWVRHRVTRACTWGRCFAPLWCRWSMGRTLMQCWARDRKSAVFFSSISWAFFEDVFFYMCLVCNTVGQHGRIFFWRRRGEGGGGYPSVLIMAGCTMEELQPVFLARGGGGLSKHHRFVVWDTRISIGVYARVFFFFVGIHVRHKKCKTTILYKAKKSMVVR